MKTKLNIAALFAIALAIPTTDSFAQAKKPNILVIFGDDIGITDVSAYSSGLMGFETPNIDRIGKEGIRFLQYYGEQSCTAGRRRTSARSLEALSREKNEELQEKGPRL